MEHHYVMGKINCPKCGMEKEDSNHVGIIFINGYPAECSNNGKNYWEYEGISAPILKRGPYLGRENRI